MPQLILFIARHLAARPKLLLVCLVLVTILMAGSARGVRPDYSGVSFDVQESESARAYHEFSSAFGGDAYLLLAFAHGSRITDPHVKNSLAAAGKEIAAMAGILRVSDLARLSSIRLP
ncbi:MAG TPA: hypothetical protein DHV36_08145, partial [Desulfobacteraceae bacterium]|nr:hypothetical protein [Desulfobacteraceae bacterium]